MKDCNYIIILDYTCGKVIKIKLTEQQKKELEEIGDEEIYLASLEEKYNFNLSNCNWMSVKNYEEYNYGF